MQTPASIENLSFPVLLWRKGYFYVASEPIELSTHPRSLFEETKQRARDGEFRIADSEGRVFEVKDYEPVAPFGGLKRLGHLLLRSRFAVPVCSLVDTPEFPAFRAIVSKVVVGRFGKQFVAELEAAENARQILKVIADRDRKAG